MHCMGRTCGEFHESECCQTTCWAAGWRDQGGAPSVGRTLSEAGLTGEAACEDRGYGPLECAAVGCCAYDKGQCRSAVGDDPCSSGEGGSGESGSGDSGSGDFHGTHQCPAGQQARPSNDMHDCGDRYAAAVSLSCLARRVLRALAPRLLSSLARSLPPSLAPSSPPHPFPFHCATLCHPCPTAAGTQVHGASRVLHFDVLVGGVARLW